MFHRLFRRHECCYYRRHFFDVGSHTRTRLSFSFSAWGITRALSEYRSTGRKEKRREEGKEKGRKKKKRRKKKGRVYSRNRDNCERRKDRGERWGRKRQQGRRNTTNALTHVYFFMHTYRSVCARVNKFATLPSEQVSWIENQYFSPKIIEEQKTASFARIFSRPFHERLYAPRFSKYCRSEILRKNSDAFRSLAAHSAPYSLSSWSAIRARHLATCLCESEHVFCFSVFLLRCQFLTIFYLCFYYMILRKNHC